MKVHSWDLVTNYSWSHNLAYNPSEGPTRGIPIIIRDRTPNINAD